MQRISSGTRLIDAASDAAGGSIASKLKARVGSTQQAIRNANDGISVLQTAEGSAKEVSKILQRARELAVQAASDTLTDDQRTYNSNEMKELTVEVGRIADSLEFNGQSLGSGSTLIVQVGANSDTTSNTIKFRTMDLKTIATAMKSIDLASSSNARAGLKAIDTQMDELNTGRASMGANYNRMESALANASENLLAITASASRISDTDYAHESAQLTAHQIRISAGAAALGQANQMAVSVMSLI